MLKIKEKLKIFTKNKGKPKSALYNLIEIVKFWQISE